MTKRSAGMTIDEAINELKDQAKTMCTLCSDYSFPLQLAKWMEELKWLKETSLFTKAQLELHKECAYNKAIDNCNKIIENAFDANIINSIAYARITMNFEQLKDGGNNG